MNKGLNQTQVASSASGLCTCGRPFRVFQPEGKKLADDFRNAVGEFLDVFICDAPEKHCSVCGQTITMPIPEELDIERNWLVKLVQEICSSD